VDWVEAKKGNDSVYIYKEEGLIHRFCLGSCVRLCATRSRLGVTASQICCTSDSGLKAITHGAEYEC
jgi:chemotaxis receptor (MCP) glutamine deamidase CheD